MFDFEVSVRTYPESSKHTLARSHDGSQQHQRVQATTHDAADGLSLTHTTTRRLAHSPRRPRALARAAHSLTHPRPGTLRLPPGRRRSPVAGSGAGGGGAVEGSGLAPRHLAALNHAVARHPDVGYPSETVACESGCSQVGGKCTCTCMFV